ncbi:hypothetical protein ACH6EH_06815 [Paenibacillus sp. JSM ZJ436]|uniref:hypothetical protein n=1 Tax=Paenibacillus sp. JSM ZJ436 TaxID=3376190 RepID=UPI0037B9408B
MLMVGDIVVKNNVQLKVLGFSFDFDMLTDEPYRVATLIDSHDRHVIDVAESVVLKHYQVNQIDNVGIRKVLVATMYDLIGNEYMDFEVSNEEEVNKIISEYNATGEYKLKFHGFNSDYKYYGVRKLSH